MPPAKFHSLKMNKRSHPSTIKNLILIVQILAAIATAVAAPNTLRDPQYLVALTKEQPSGTKLTIPSGIYRLSDLPGAGLRFRNLKDVEIVAEGVTIVMKPAQTIAFERCRNLVLRGLAVDFDPVPWSQGIITDIQQAQKSVSVKLESGYPHLENLPQKDSLLYFVFDPVTLEPRHLLWEGFREFASTG